MYLSPSKAVSDVGEVSSIDLFQEAVERKEQFHCSAMAWLRHLHGLACQNTCLVREGLRDQARCLPLSSPLPSSGIGRIEWQASPSRLFPCTEDRQRPLRRCERLLEAAQFTVGIAPTSLPARCGTDAHGFITEPRRMCGIVFGVGAEAQG